MSTLSGQKIKDKFGNLLHVEGGITSTTKDVEDGTGDASALKLSTTTVEVDGTLNFTSAPSTDNSEQTALFINGSDNVVKRELGTSAFKAERPRIIARQASDNALTSGTNADLAFAAVDNSDANASFAEDDDSNYRLEGSSTRIVVGNSGVYRIDVSLSLVNNGNVTVTIELRKNGAELVTAVRTKSGADSMTSFYYAQKLEADDYITVNVAAASAGTTIEAGSCVELLQIATS
jgi:hypothetical protein